MTVIELLLEPYSYAFMQRALMAALAASVVCALLSCWLVLIGWSLMGDAVSHSVLPGVALAYMVGVPFAIGAVVFGFLSVGLIGAVQSRTPIKEDAAIGIVFSTLFALGIVLISVVPSQTDLTHIIFGNLLGVGPAELWQVLGIAAFVAAALLIKRRDFTLFAFDPTHAHAIGLRPKLLSTALLALLALTAVVALQVVGVVLVVAMLIIPGATAQLITDRFAMRLVFAPVFAAICGVFGLTVSYFTNTAPGGSIVLTQGLAFLVVLGWRALSRGAQARAAEREVVAAA